MASNNNHIDVPVHDSWDNTFYNTVCDEAETIFFKTHTPEFIEYVAEKNKAHKKYRDEVKKHGHGRVVYSSDTKNGMLGIIAQSTSPKDLRKKAIRRSENSVAASLTDLHELYRCSGKSLDELMGIPNSKMVSQIVFLSEQDILRLHSDFSKSTRLGTLFIVRCVPLLGLSLLLWQEYEKGFLRFRYKIVDSLGILNNGTKSSGVPKEIPVPDPRTFEDPSMTSNISDAYINATELFSNLCQLVKGILESKSGKRSARANAYLGKDVKAEELPFSRYVKLCGVDDDSEGQPFRTESGTFENTIQLFFDDVRAARKAQYDFDEMSRETALSDTATAAELIIADATERSKAIAHNKC